MNPGDAPIKTIDPEIKLILETRGNEQIKKVEKQFSRGYSAPQWVQILERERGAREYNYKVLQETKSELQKLEKRKQVLTQQTLQATAETKSSSAKGEDKDRDQKEEKTKWDRVRNESFEPFFDALKRAVEAEKDKIHFPFFDEDRASLLKTLNSLLPIKEADRAKPFASTPLPPNKKFREQITEMISRACYFLKDKPQDLSVFLENLFERSLIYGLFNILQWIVERWNQYLLDFATKESSGVDIGIKKVFDANGETALIAAVRAEAAWTVDALWKAGANKDDDHRALWWAAKNSESILKYLLQFQLIYTNDKLRSLLKNFSRFTSLIPCLPTENENVFLTFVSVLRQSRKEVFKQEGEQFAGLTLFLSLIQQGEVEWVRGFREGYLRFTFDYDCCNQPLSQYNRRTLVHFAAESKDEQCLRVLESPDNEIDPNIQDDLGETPLMLAIKVGNEAGTIFLIHDRNADVNLTNRKGQSALDFAVERGSKTIVQCLVTAGADCTRYATRDGSKFQTEEAKRDDYLLKAQTMVRNQVCVDLAISIQTSELSTQIWQVQNEIRWLEKRVASAPISVEQSVTAAAMPIAALI